VVLVLAVVAAVIVAGMLDRRRREAEEARSQTAAALFRAIILGNTAKHVGFVGMFPDMYDLDVRVETLGDNQRGVEYLCAAFGAVNRYQDYFNHLSQPRV
jgi:type II secretory pathway pseudopilin PulG